MSNLFLAIQSLTQDSATVRLNLRVYDAETEELKESDEPGKAGRRRQEHWASPWREGNCGILKRAEALEA